MRYSLFAIATLGLDPIYPLRIYWVMARKDPSSPLTPAVFHILLALAHGERHGYDIMQQVQTDTDGAIRMGPGTLYGSIDRMIDAGLVERSNTADPRRIY